MRVPRKFHGSPEGGLLDGFSHGGPDYP
jgi:hypothetical protein